MKILVTGGAGFIGSHLVDYLLERGHDLVVLDNLSTGRSQNLEHVRKDIRLFECDLAVNGDWHREFEGVDRVFHLAALADIVPSIKDPESYYQSNVNGTFNVLRACQEYQIGRFIYSASSSCYGIPDEYPTSESAEIRVQYPYALTKWLAEELVMHWAQVYKLPAISMRLFNVYGPRSRTSGTYGAVLGVFLAQKLSGKPYTVVGNGEQSRDFTYVSDVIRALYCASESDISGRIYNVGSGNSISINRLVELLDGEKVHIPKRPGEPDSTFADIARIQRDLSWEPETSIEEGISKLLEHIDYWSDAPVWTPDSIAVATEDWLHYLGK